MAAQHAETSPQLAGSEFERCVLCHASHHADGAPYLLKFDGSNDLNQGNTDAVSRTCLRCHWTTAARDRQPEFAVPADPTEGTYLGPVTTDDHPLGPRGGVMPGAPTSIECVSCHEPHAPEGFVVPDPVEQTIQCTVCHEAVMPAPSEHTSLACSDCHQLHNAPSGRLLKDTSADPTCLVCHTTVPSFSSTPAPFRLRGVPRW